MRWNESAKTIILASISRYRVERSTNRTSWTTVSSSINALAYTVTGLNECTTYYFRVSAYGDGSRAAARWSSASSHLRVKTSCPPTPTPKPAPEPTVVDPPGAVSSCSLASLDRGLKATWQAPSSGGAVARYEVQHKGTSSTWPSGSAVDNGTSLSRNITQLTNDVSYDVRVRACNAAGCGGWVSKTATPRGEAEPLPASSQSISISGLVASMRQGDSDSFTVSASNLVSSNSYSIRAKTGNSDIGFDGACSDRQEDVAIPAGRTSYSASFTLYGCDAPGGTVSTTLRIGNNSVASDSQHVAVTAVTPPSTPTVSTSATTTSVTEGQSITFTLTSSSAPTSNLPVNVGVTQTGSFIRGTATTSVSIPSGHTSASFNVDTDDDNVDEPSGSITATVETGTGYGVGSPSTKIVTVLDNDLPSLVSPTILGVDPLPLRRAKLRWRGVPNVDSYSVEARGSDSKLPWAAPDGTPTCAIPPAQTAEVCSVDFKLDRVVHSRGFGHADAFEFKVKAMSNSGTILPAYSDTITIIDNPILTGGRVTGYNVGTEGRAVLQWGRIPEATDYVVEYRKLGRRPSYEGIEGLSHTEENWPGALSWPYYEDVPASPLEFGAGASDPVGRPVTGLELGGVYAIQVNYRTSTTTVYSARDAYVWPSSDYPENGKRVGTYTFFGHHEDKEFEYIICKDTFPAGQRNQWVELIKSAFGQWAASTDEFITMIPRIDGEDGRRCSDTSLPISQFIMEDDERNEVRMFGVEDGLPVTGNDSNLSLSEIKSDAFKICVARKPACVTSFTGYAGIDFRSDQRERIADIVASRWPLFIKVALASDILNRYGSHTRRQASNTIKSVDVNFRMHDPESPDPERPEPQFKLNMPYKVQFNTCFRSPSDPNSGDATTEKYYYPYATAVHEAGHALGLSNINYPVLLTQPDDAAHPTIPDAAMNYDSRAKSAFPGWRILNPGHEEPDCSPHPFDVMAIFALYGRVP